VHGVLVYALAKQNQSVSGLHRRPIGTLPRGQQYAVARGSQLLRDAAEQYKRVGIEHGAIGGGLHFHDYRNRVAAAKTQIACTDVELVAMLKRECLDPFASFRIDQRAVAQRPGNRDFR